VSNPPRVMVVEDEAIISLDIQRQLAIAGFEVAGKAQTAEGAFRGIERENPDIVLMDIRLKGEMDGVEAAAIIRSRYGLPVVYLTAHTDGATLQRAQDTEPFGFLVKPLVNANLKAAITMAIHKHRMERELENSRKLLSTILHGLPDAVLVARASGEIVFLNHVAEQTTGWSLREATGKSILQVASIQGQDGTAMTLELLLKVGGDNASPLRIPPHSTMTSKDGKRIDIAGQLSAMSVDNRTAGVFMTLQDVTLQNREEQRIRQERQMFVAAELAHGVALEFYSLFGVIDQAAEGISKSTEKNEVDLMRAASNAGTQMATQLLEFREGNGAAHIVNLTQYIRASQTLLQGICGKDVKLVIESELDVGYILSTGNHFEQLLVNLVLEGKQRLEGPGQLTIGLDIHTQAVSGVKAGSYIRLSMRAEKPPGGESIISETLPLSTELPGLGLTIVRTIAIASDGFVRVSEPNELTTLIEVFLPRHESRISAAAAANEYSQVMLMVGFPESVVQSMRANFDQDVLLLGAATAEEASWISELYEGDIDLVILGKNCLLNDDIDRARNRIRFRRPNVGFIESSFTNDDSAMELLRLTETFRKLLQSKAVGEIGAAKTVS
jgi:two-component system, cell cycle sensor histidine kinase and response regulator CckA